MTRLQHHYDSAPQKQLPSKNMKGFDPEFSDIVDYILRITYRIWEGKQIGLCYDYYSQDCPVYTLGGYTQGAEEVVQNTLNTLAAFPDRTLDADNIIWGGNEKDGFHSSHLIDTKMTNLGDSDLGAATGRKAQFKVIAHCVVKNNMVIEEWLVRDNYALVKQLGFKPKKVVKNIAKSAPEPRFEEWRLSELERLSALELNHRAEIYDHMSSEEFVLASLQNIWNARMLGDVVQAYDDAALVNASADNNAEGHEEIIRFYGSFLGNFSNLKVSLDYSCQQPSKKGGDDVAVRWTMSGTHTGRGQFGGPSNAPILIIGESQYRVENKKIQEECTVFDKIAVLTQIERARRSQE